MRMTTNKAWEEAKKEEKAREKEVEPEVRFEDFREFVRRVVRAETQGMGVGLRSKLDKKFSKCSNDDELKQTIVWSKSLGVIIDYDELLYQFLHPIAKINIDPECKQILEHPNLWEMIDEEFNKKIEGEELARRSIFFTFNMRNVKNLNKASDNLMINDEGGVGKDHVVSAVFDIIPDSEKVKKVRISPKVLAYLHDDKNNPEGWVKKCLYLEDVPNNVINDDAFKVMASAEPNGRTETSIVVNNSIKNINIVGKPSIVITVASTSPKWELLRRFPIHNLTSSVNQTKAILRKQAFFAERGVSIHYNSLIKKSLSYLKRVDVRIPFAINIASKFPHENTIVRTHFPRFLDMIKSCCALYQYQRKVDEEGYYLATAEDYELARSMLLATTSNQFMIPLTKLQRNILEKFSELEFKTWTFEELEKEMQVIAEGRWLRNQLNILVKARLLTRGNERKEGSIKPVATYEFNPTHRVDIPKFEDLFDKNIEKTSSNNTHNTNSSHNTNNTNWRDKASPSNMNNLHDVNKMHTCVKLIKVLSPCVDHDGNEMKGDVDEVISVPNETAEFLIENGWGVHNDLS